MIRFPQFRLKYMTWRVSQFRELGDLRNLKELPLDAYLICLDNFQKFGQLGISLGPSLDNPIIGLNNYKLLIHSVTQPVEGIAPLVTERMILTNAGVTSQLMNYKRDMSPRVVYYDSIRDIPSRPNVQRIVNLNPLFRARVLGIRRKPRFFNMLLASMINVMMQDPQGMFFIHVPLESLMFDRKDFARVFRKYDRIATKYPECASYLFLAHLYSILMKPVALPPRGIKDEDGKDLAAVESLGEELHDVVDMTSEDFMRNVFDYELGDPEFALEALKLKDSENPYKLSIFECLPPKMYEHINFIFTCGGQYIIYNMRDLKELNGRSGTGIFRIIKHINLLAACGSPSELPMEEPPMVAESVVNVDDSGETANQPEFKQPMTTEEKQDAIDQDLSELDDFEKIINTNVDTQTKPLTTAQKEHVKTISKAYKKCTINGKTFEELLTTIPEVDLTSPATPEVKTDEKAGGETVTSKQAAPSTTASLDANYVKHSMDKDIAAIVTSFNKQGMFLTEFDEKTVIDELNAKKVYTAKYEDVNHKKHTIRFTLPKVDEFGRFLDNGSYKTINKQRVSNPITKASGTRVTLNSNYNKLLVERNTNTAHSFLSWFMKALEKANQAGFKTMLVHSKCEYPIKALPFELTEIGQKYSRINFQNGCLFFDVMKRASAIPAQLASVVPGMEKDNGVWFGYRGEDVFFITVTGCVVAKNYKTNEESFYGSFIDFFEWLLNIKLNNIVEFTELTVLSKVVPLIHPLAYRYGLTNMLQYCNVDYEVHDIHERTDKRTSDIIIKFSDKKLVIRRTPRNNALLFGGLCVYDFSDVMLEDMDNKDIYYELLAQKKLSANLIKGIDALFDLFIDPITRDVLREMKEPTDLRDLLLRANTMLTTSEHKNAASSTNFRFRGVEQITGIVYNEMAKAFATFKNRSIGATNHFSISDYQIKQRIMHEQLVENVSVINPINDIKQYSKFSNTGSGGRSNETFMIPDRNFTKDSIGIVSEATVDNGKTGLNAMLPFDPIIVNERGMSSQDIDITKLKPENFLSITSLLYPQVTNDDSKRACFVNIQASHYVPIKESEVSRVRTGFEEAVAQRSTDPHFAYSAKQEGTILDIDEATKTMVIRYKDGNRVCLQYGSQSTNNSANGFFVNQEVAVNGFKKGDKFKQGDILTYNHQFFQADPYTKQVRWKIGTLAKVALMDNGGTIEDASVLTQPLCDRMVFNPVHVKQIEITKDTNVHAYADIGTHVVSTEPVIVFDQSAMSFGDEVEDDPELMQILSDMNKSAPKAEYSGEIVQIDALYKCPISSMSPSLQKIVKKVAATKNARADKAANCSNSTAFQRSVPLEATDKVGIVDLTPDTVILRFYIRQNKGMSPGDKLFFDSSLKSVCSTVYPETIKTEDGQDVEALTSCRGVLARLITSPFTTGLANGILEKVEKDVLALWEGKTPTDQNTGKPMKV